VGWICEERAGDSLPNVGSFETTGFISAATDHPRKAVCNITATIRRSRIDVLRIRAILEQTGDRVKAEVISDRDQD
jgi:hypothetical protein